MNTKKKTNTKLTNEAVDSRLLEATRPIIRIGNVVNSATKIKWNCTVCAHEWDATPNSVLNLGSGCPSCAGTIKHTAATIDDKIGGRRIVRIGEYVNYDTPIEWECAECHHAWMASPNNILHGTGCPVCSAQAAGKTKSLGQYDRVCDILVTNQLTLITPYTRIIDKHTINCQVCNHSWDVRLNDIVNNNNGCPSCTGLVKLTNEIVDQRLVTGNRMLVRVGDIVNATTKIEWKCQHGHLWSATPDSVLNLQSGCPMCNNVGVPGKLYFERCPHKKNVPGRLYLIEGEYNDVRFIKVGITERAVNRRFAGDLQKYQIQEISHIETTMWNAYQLEQEILHKYIDRLYQPSPEFDGKTECLRYDPKIIKDILQTYFMVEP